MASYVSPEIRDRFDTLSADLKNLILERNVCLNNMYDLIHVLEDIVAEGEAEKRLPLLHAIRKLILPDVSFLPRSSSLSQENVFYI